MTTSVVVVPTQRSVAAPTLPTPLPDPRRRVVRPTRSTWVHAGVGVLVAGALMALARGALGDDSYISLDYARTLLEHGQWGLVPGRTANTATSPLNVWLLAGALGVTGTVTGAVGLVLALAFAVIGGGTARLARLVSPGPVLPLAAMALLATSPLLVSTIGLETYLGVAAVVAVATAAASGRPALAGVLCGVAMLVRPDYAIPALVVLVLLWRPVDLRARVRGLLLAGGVAAVVALPWHLWAWFELGGFVPDTFSFKTNPAAGHLPSMIAEFDNLYWSRTPVAVVVVGITVVAAWALALAVVASRLRRLGRARPRPAGPGGLSAGRLVVAFAGSGTAHVVALMVINAYPQAWYFGPLVAGSALAVAVALAARPARSRALAAGGLAVYCAGALVVAGQGGVPWTAADMNSNFTDPAAYLRVGHELPGLVGDVSVAPPGEVGAITWGCRCDMVDQFSARAYARPLLDHRYDLGGHLSRVVLRLNWHHRPDVASPQPAYRLRYVRGDDPTPADVRHTWWVTSPQTGPPFRIVLVPTSP
ncbi:MAG TPA: glycosyltransferase 87 family protein [Actinomycetospora sp.]|uniref:glycosyltransferase 87 family protein n=1 Tax=Actinomycetospora sp. TaxID=1872135 RepID=UPI002F3FD5AE